jgi:uncharacterized protein CbrC (UPF0167 family)
VTLPAFRYHLDPLGSGSVVSSMAECRCCRRRRGYVYTGPVYSDAELDDALCPWCIADGSAHREFGATFVDGEAFPRELPEPVVAEISQRTPGYDTWQREQWPACCDDATAFLTPAGIADIRKGYRELEGNLLGHIVYNMAIPASVAIRLLESLNRDTGPTAYLFRCLGCGDHHFHIDRP